MAKTNWIVNKEIDIRNFDSIINNTLIEEVDLLKKSTRGFSAKQYDLYNHKDKFKVVIDDIKRELRKIDNSVNYNLVSAWTVIGEENSYHTVHRHNEANVNHIATVLYLKVPKSNTHQTGNFYYFLNENDNVSYGLVAPKKGTFIVMPINLLHGSYPQAKGIRQTLNMDFEIVK